MVRIAAIIGEYFEDSEYLEPATVFRNEGHDVVTVGLEAGSMVEGKRGKVSAKIDRAVRDVSVDDFDALFIPGGHSPDALRADRHAVDFVKRFVESGKPVLSICHAPQLFITAGILKGRKVAGWKSIVTDIQNAGGTFVDREVVEDGNIVSSRSPKDIPAFIESSLKKLNEVYASKAAGGAS